MANRRAATVGVEPQRGGQHGQLRGAQCAYRDQGAVGSEPGAHRAHLGDASLELLGEQADDEDQDGMDQPHPALDPAYRAREPDRVAAQRIGRRAHTRSPLGMRHQASSRSERNHRFERIEFTGQPCSQTVRQQAEGGVALGAVPASDLRPARGLARVGAVACQRTSAVRVIRAALKPCIAPRLGPNVSLAGEPRLIPKLQPAVARRGRPPARANSFLVQRAVETTTRLPRHQAVTMGTRPPVKLGAGSAHRAPSYGPCGQGVDKCAALDHPFPTLGTLASTSSAPRQQSFMRKATSPPVSASRTVPSSQEIRLRNIPVKSRGDPTS